MLEAVRNLNGSMAAMDLAKLHALGPKLMADGALLDEFKLAPEIVAQREAGVTVPFGVHLHYIDEQNNYFPPEGNALDQILKEKGLDRPWGRTETRIGGGGGPSAAWCIGACGACL